MYSGVHAKQHEHRQSRKGAAQLQRLATVTALPVASPTGNGGTAAETSLP
ncbi:hypothetical protein [Thermosynechococcus sp.]